MLELSKDADYDTLAAASIFTIAILGKAWVLLKNRLEKSHDWNGPHLGS